MIAVNKIVKDQLRTGRIRLFYAKLNVIRNLRMSHNLWILSCTHDYKSRNTQLDFAWFFWLISCSFFLKILLLNLDMLAKVHLHERSRLLNWILARAVSLLRFFKSNFDILWLDTLLKSNLNGKFTFYQC